jgi:ribosome-binding ATPase
MLQIGIVGLPNVGKSTLFNALTKSKQANAQNFPFCTIEPNVGIVEVPDKRLAPIAEVAKSGRIIPTAIEFVDIAGLVQGASEGAGLGNKFLAHIREVNAIAQVVRAFSDENVIHVCNRVDPVDDAKIIGLELILADLATATKRRDVTRGKAKGVNAKEFEKELALLDELIAHLESEKPARQLVVDDEDKQVVMRELCLLSAKPMLYVVNCDEAGQDVSATLSALKAHDSAAEVITVSAKLEAELIDLSSEDAAMLLSEAGMSESGLDKMIRAGYQLLQLQTYFTAGEMETRAWTVPANTLAPDAAGVIHTDFVKKFVKADITNWEHFVSQNGWSGVRESGKLQLVGRDYIVKDGDVCYFHIAS